MIANSFNCIAGIPQQLAIHGWNLALNYWAPYYRLTPCASLPLNLRSLPVSCWTSEPKSLVCEVLGCAECSRRA